MNNSQTSFDKLPQDVQNTMIGIGQDQGMAIGDIKNGFNKAQRKLRGHSNPWDIRRPNGHER